MIIPFPQQHRETKVAAVFPLCANGTRTVPLYASPVSAGFPSLAEEYTEGQIDLNEQLIDHPNDTFVVKVSGDSMIDAGIHPDDLLIVDRARSPESGSVVIAVINGELTVKRLVKQAASLYLMPENPGYPGIEITEDMHFMVWGVVTNVIHPL